ncbi:helix-turn-helix domain-containing protein [Kocuria sp. cx-455]|uniref:GbsR/MarR family transcriptional regulator n=1 Tax=Kocuria sp. cx-455 TaxID=2771377 RepID=UPI0016828D0C|nr:helix-turn-helix domain-containing protein [Kocuria sp. cx-455]MBD2764312.1 helix-turn-helix domain-containing protein [Kocuria sp. cx-455]
MVVSRLSLEDRQTIAAGLAEGRSYAQIARQIGRPTSTVSREVARNGHRDYDAADAQQTKRRRTCKRVTVAPANSAEDVQHAFITELASTLTATGMPRMASRVFASLATSTTDTMTAADLVRGLGVSPASVSKAIGYLEGIELVERHVEPGSRKERYGVGDDVWTRAVRTDSSGHASVADVADRGIALFGDESPAGIRLAHMGRFFASLTEQLRGSNLADPTVDDAMTIVAALGHTRHRMTRAQLATTLEWSTRRLDDALQQLRQHPVFADPFTVHENNAGYCLQARPDRLSAQQHAALQKLTASTDDQ